MLGTRLPPRLLRGESGGHDFPIIGSAYGQHLADAGQAGAGAEEVAHGYLVFALLRELGPVLGDWSIDVEQPLVGETMRADGRHAFRGGEDVDNGVPLPGAR